MNERYAFLRLPINKFESFKTRDEAETRLAHVKATKKLQEGRRCQVGTNGCGDWWVEYTLAR